MHQLPAKLLGVTLFWTRLAYHPSFITSSRLMPLKPRLINLQSLLARVQSLYPYCSGLKALEHGLEDLEIVNVKFYFSELRFAFKQHEMLRLCGYR